MGFVEINVKYKGKSFPVSVDSDATITDLKSIILDISDVLPRGQKLVAKGKVLEDHWTIKESLLENGGNVMLIASQGLHQGSGASSSQKAKADAKSTVYISDIALDNDCFSRWKITGVVVLSRCNLKAIPSEVWEYGPCIRVLDINNNFFDKLPAQLGNLSGLQKLYIDNNGLTTESVDWEALTSLKQLTIISACHNSFTSIPIGFAAFCSLKNLNLAYNKLTELPADIGLLIQLEFLYAKHNRISFLPESIGKCVSLIEVDLSFNVLTTLPDTMEELKNMKTLYLSNNGLKSLPSRLFKMCQNLSTLNVHNTQITIDMLRQFDGWEDFDKRRLAKQQKKLDFRVLDSDRFDEGADML